MMNNTQNEIIKAWREYAEDMGEDGNTWNEQELKEWAKRECESMANLICDGRASKMDIEWTPAMATWALSE